MTSRERVLAAIRRADTDHLPCSIYFNNNMRSHGYDPGSPESVIGFHESLGVDPVVDLPYLAAPPDARVVTRVWTDDAAQPHPVLYKEYRTPAGTLRIGVRRTADWPFGGDIPFPGDDFCASHLVEPLVKTPEDVDAFSFLCRPPTGADADRLAGRIASVKEAASRHGVAVRATVGQGLAELLFQMGAENLVLFAMDHREALRRLARLDSDATLARIALYAELGVDLLKRFGGYEQTNFFSPAIFADVVAPLLRREVEAARGIRVPIYYRVVTGMKPLLAQIADIGFDCVEGFEPCLSDCSNRTIRDALGGRACLWTGVSSPGHIGSTDPEAVRRAVREAVDCFGRKGFILGVTNSIRAHWKWENTLAMIDEWKRCRG